MVDLLAVFCGQSILALMTMNDLSMLPEATEPTELLHAMALKGTLVFPVHQLASMFQALEFSLCTDLMCLVASSAYSNLCIQEGKGQSNLKTGIACGKCFIYALRSSQCVSK